MCSTIYVAVDGPEGRLTLDGPLPLLRLLLAALRLPGDCRGEPEEKEGDDAA